MLLLGLLGMRPGMVRLLLVCMLLMMTLLFLGSLELEKPLVQSYLEGRLLRSPKRDETVRISVD